MADTDQVLNLAAIIRKVDGNHSKGAAALAESILDHPRFRAVLAGEPAVPQGREPASVTGQPSDEELLELYQGPGTFSPIEYARAVLARWGNPAPQPADGEVAELVRTMRMEVAAWNDNKSATYWLSGPEIARVADLLEQQVMVPPPADGEVAELVAEIRHFLAGYQQMRGLDPEHIYSIHRGDKMEAHITVSRLTRAAELLERQALVPVSISERLPGPEDCAPWPQPSDKSGWCWMSRTVHGFYGSFAIWEQVSVVPMCREVYTHWLPAHDLPVPEVGE